MAAGLGFKTFTTGEVLTAADTNGYLMQGVLVFASSAARASAITSPQEGQYSYLKDTDALEYYSGIAWVGAPVGDITGVTAGTGISGGGTSGTVTVSIDTSVTVDKTTAQTLTNKTLTSPALTTPTISTLTTNGDLLYGTGSGALSRLGIGSSAQVLTVTGGVPVWAAAGGSTFVGCSVYTSNITLSNNTSTAVTWASENYDTDAIHSTASNTSRFTVPAGKAGKWLLTSNIQYNSNATGVRGNAVKVNGSTYQADNYFAPTNGAESSVVMSLVLNLSAADYVEIFAYQNSGGNLLLVGGAYGSWLMFSYLGA